MEVCQNIFSLHQFTDNDDDKNDAGEWSSKACSKKHNFFSASGLLLD